MKKLFGPYDLVYTPQGTETFRLILTLKDDIITKATVDLCGSYKGLEKQLERLNLEEACSALVQLSPANAFSRELAWIQGVEPLLEIKPPKEVRLMRALLLESERVMEHLRMLLHLTEALRLTRLLRPLVRLLGTFETLSSTVLREEPEATSAAPLMPLQSSLLLPGGFRESVFPDRLFERLSLWTRFFAELVPPALHLTETLLLRNPLFQDRAMGLAFLSPEAILTSGLSGPTARASGVAFDRRIFPNGLPEELELPEPEDAEPPLSVGDVFARTAQRVKEIRQSLALIAQAHRLLQATWANQPEDAARASLQGPWQPLYSAHYAVRNVASFVESPHGELGFFLVSHGDRTLYRARLISPAFPLVQALPSLLVGTSATDLSLILASLDITSEEIIR